MDRFIHTALNSLNIVKDNAFIRSNNLANNSVPGFRADTHPQNIWHSLYRGYGFSCYPWTIN